MQKICCVFLAMVCLASGAPQLMAGDGSDKSWIRSYTQAFRDPANYPGRAVYAGSRYGYAGYVRPYVVADPFPRTMRKVTPPTMYHWSKSNPRSGPGFYDRAMEIPRMAPAYDDYYAE